MSDKEKLIVKTGIHPKLVSRLLTFGIGLAAIVSLVAIGVVGGVNTVKVQQAYAQENSNACPEGYTKIRGFCYANVIPGEEGGCPEGFPEQTDEDGEVFCGKFVGRNIVTEERCQELDDLREDITTVFVPDPRVPPPLGICNAYQTADRLPSSEPTCPVTGNFREPEIVNGQCQVRPGEGEPEPGDDEDEEVEV